MVGWFLSSSLLLRTLVLRKVGAGGQRKEKEEERAWQLSKSLKRAAEEKTGGIRQYDQVLLVPTYVQKKSLIPSYNKKMPLQFDSDPFPQIANFFLSFGWHWWILHPRSPLLHTVAGPLSLFQKDGEENGARVETPMTKGGEIEGWNKQLLLVCSIRRRLSIVVVVIFSKVQ